MPRDLIVTVCPGATTTRCAVYQMRAKSKKCVAEDTLAHDEAVLATLPGYASQHELRLWAVQSFLDGALKDTDRVVAVAAPAGMLPVAPAGVIEVTADLAQTALYAPVYHHPSNLGPALALALAASWEVPAFVADPATLDEFRDVARLSGTPEMPRFSDLDALNIRAAGRKLAKDSRKGFDELRAVIAQLDDAISIAPLIGGKLVDGSHWMEGAPFSTTSAGGLPPLSLIDQCFSGYATRDGLVERLYAQGGVHAYLGTADIAEVEARIDAGDTEAARVLDAMIYQIAKTIGAMASVVAFDLDAIVLTGELAKSDQIVAGVSAAVERIAPVKVYPGSDSCAALADNAIAALKGTSLPHSWAALTAPAFEVPSAA
ncbi:butyrate kinase [Litorisediminicola beolgyonensis]|uniref:Probable butyrate kinase n=1 Tax=Litorisediminicola beolgyonensis TaxID=1173614 RepID=A0ABW3ZNC8_9RHOB